MMQRVQTLEGHEALVVDEGDLLSAERQMKWWLAGIIGAILAAGLLVGISYATIVAKVDQNTVRIEEVRREGSLPLKEMQADLKVMAGQLRQNAARQQEIIDLIKRSHR